MKNKINTLIFALACLFFAPLVFAADFTAAQLYDFCQKNSDANNNVQLSIDDQFKAGYCMGYIKGLDDLLYIHYSMYKKQKITIYMYCMPDGVTLNEMSKIFIEYMKKHSALNDEDAGKVLIKALIDKYSCK